MKVQKFKTFMNVALLFSSVAILTNCEWFKKGGECPAPTNSNSNSVGSGSNLSGTPLLTMEGKALITDQSFEEFWKSFLESSPQYAAVVNFYPNIRQEMFKNTLLPMEIASVYVQKSGKSNDKEYKNKLAQACSLIEKQMALSVLQEEIVKSIDKSDAALRKFYSANKDKNQMFKKEPFIKVHPGVEVLSVDFSNEEDAKNFLDKAKKEGTDFNALAGELNKEVKNLGFVSIESENVAPTLRFKASNMKPGDISKIEIKKDKFAVVKALSKRDAKYSSFDEVISDPQVKEVLNQALLQAEFADILNKKIEDLKKQYKIEEHPEFFEKELEKRKSDNEAMAKKMKEIQKSQKDSEE